MVLVFQDWTVSERIVVSGLGAPKCCKQKPLQLETLVWEWTCHSQCCASVLPSQPKRGSLAHVYTPEYGKTAHLFDTTVCAKAPYPTMSNLWGRRCCRFGSCSYDARPSEFGHPQTVIWYSHSSSAAWKAPFNSFPCSQAPHAPDMFPL